MAAELGFEPRLNESESFVLPLHNSATSTEHHMPDQRISLYIVRAEMSSQISNFIRSLPYLAQHENDRAEFI